MTLENDVEQYVFLIDFSSEPFLLRLTHFVLFVT